MAQPIKLDSIRNTPQSLLFGVNMVADKEILFRPEGYQDQVYQTLRKLGGTMVRIAASMREIEKVRGTRDWTHFDEELGYALKYGMTPMICIVNTPLWALPETPGLPKGMDPTYQYPYADEFFPDFEDFCRELGERTKDKVTLYQMWNEPNGCSWHFHDGYNHADEYVPFMNVARKGVKAGNPGAVFLLGSLDDAAGNGHIFLNMCYDIRDKQFPGERLFDGVTLHPYDYDMKSMKNKIMRIHEIMKRNGDGDLPIYITEYGWRTGAERDGEKCEKMRGTLELFQDPEIPYLKGSIQLALADFGGEPGFGMTDENLRPRESFYAFQGAPKFGASPPHHIHWMPVSATEIEVTWETVLPATSELITGSYVQYYGKWAGIYTPKPGERMPPPEPPSPEEIQAAVKAYKEKYAESFKNKKPEDHVPVKRASAMLVSKPDTKHRALISGLNERNADGFSIQTKTVDGMHEYRTPYYSIRVPTSEIYNGNFDEGFFAGIAEGWRINGDGLCTEGKVFPNTNTELKQSQVIFGLPERNMPLNTTAHTWFITKPGEISKITARLADVSIVQGDQSARILGRVGLDPSGGEIPGATSVVWSEWRELAKYANELKVEAPATGTLMTVFVQGRSEGKVEKGRPAMAIAEVSVVPSNE